MFNENLKVLRKQKGMSQDMLAMQLHVVRQTISKWEKGISIPDADLLIRLADILDVHVSQLLGGKIEEEENKDEIAEQLAQIAGQLAAKNRRSSRIWKVVIGIVATIIAINLLLIILSFSTHRAFTTEPRVNSTGEIFYSVSRMARSAAAN